MEVDTESSCQFQEIIFHLDIIFYSILPWCTWEIIESIKKMWSVINVTCLLTSAHLEGYVGSYLWSFSICAKQYGVTFLLRQFLGRSCCEEIICRILTLRDYAPSLKSIPDKFPLNYSGKVSLVSFLAKIIIRMAHTVYMSSM